MFVIPVKFQEHCAYILDLIPQIRGFHPHEKIVVVDSDSENRDYMSAIEGPNVEILDVHNKNYQFGAYWTAFKKFPDEPYYFFLHDSMKVKAPLDYLKKQDLHLIATFDRMINPSFNALAAKIEGNTPLQYKNEGWGCYGGMFFCKNHVMSQLEKWGVDQFMPTNKAETGPLEGAYGFFFEAMGFNLPQCALFGDILEEESPRGRSGPFPHNTSWQWPIEKMYGYHEGRR